MISLTEADLFFATHPLQNQYLSFEPAIRNAAVTTAERDVCAALERSALSQEEESSAAAAICEQALFLLLNPEYLTGRSGTASAGSLSPRAEALLAPLRLEPVQGFRFHRG